MEQSATNNYQLLSLREISRRETISPPKADPPLADNFQFRKGQSLVEILIAVSVGAIFIIAAGTLIAVTMRISAQNKFLQPASFLAQDLLDKVTVFAEYKWHCPTNTLNCFIEGTTNRADYGIYNIPNKGDGSDPITRYRLKSGVSGAPYLTPFQWEQSEEQISLDSVIYNRYFHVQNVCRNSSGNILSIVVPPATCASNSPEDPSTQKVTAVVSWNQAGLSGEVKISKFLTRSRNQVFHQTDWSGGPGQTGLWSNKSKFDTASNIEYTTVGQIKGGPLVQP